MHSSNSFQLLIYLASGGCHEYFAAIEVVTKPIEAQSLGLLIPVAFEYLVLACNVVWMLLVWVQ